MLKKIIQRTLEHSHPWRDIGFTELSELYISCMLRTMAGSLMLVFVPYFLYQNNYSFAAIMATFGCVFGSRIVADIGAAYLVARVGPKHTHIVSCLTLIIGAALLATVPIYHWPVWLIGGFIGVSASLYFLAYHVQFSKIKHADHVGKELGYMQIFEKTGYVIGPLLGGLAGAIFGPRYIFVFACFILLASLWPLFQTSEPVKIHQKLYFKKLPVAKIKQDLISYSALGLENTTCINLWPFFVALFILTSGVYVQLGALISLSTLVSIAAAYMVGKLIDRENPRPILRFALVINALLYPIRPFINSVFGVFALNTTNEVATTAYRMPYAKGMYGAADDLPGLRIVYIASMELVANVFKSTYWFILAIMALVISIKIVMFIGFAVAAVASLLIMQERFAALDGSVRRA